MTMTRFLRRWPLLILLTGACCTGGPDPLFVVASRAAHDAIAPEYLRYVAADQALTEEQRARRRATVERWGEAIAVREVQK